MTLLLLLLPSLMATMCLVFALLSSFGTILLLYFTLPMFYTVYYRLKYDVTGIGDPNFSYKDAYNQFFKGPMSGVFGVISAVIFAFGIGLLFYYVFSFLFGPLASAFNVYEPYEKYLQVIQTQGVTQGEIFDAISLYGPALSAPLIVIFGLVLYLPLMFGIFFSIDGNILNYHLSTIILPDIEKNMPAGRARAFANGTYGKPYMKYRIVNSLKKNWPYLLTFTAIYGLLVYAITFVKTDNIWLVPILTFTAPGLSLIVGFYLNYFCLMNDIITMEESQDYIREAMPKEFRYSLYQTYIHPNYVHGEESAIRGSFFPAPTDQEMRDFHREAWNQQQNNIYEEPKDEKAPEAEKKDPVVEENPEDREIKGGIFDFSDDGDKK